MKIKSKSYAYFESYIWCIDENCQHLLKINPKGWKAEKAIFLENFGYTYNTEIIPYAGFLYCVNLNNGIILKFDIDLDESIICKSSEAYGFASALIYKDRLILIPKESSNDIIYFFLHTEEVERRKFLGEKILKTIENSKICNVCMLDGSKLVITFVSAFYYAILDLDTGHVEIRDSHHRLYKCVIKRNNDEIIFSYRERMGYLLLNGDEKEQEKLFTTLDKNSDFFIRLLQVGDVTFAMTDNQLYVIDEQGELIDLSISLKCDAKEKSLFFKGVLIDENYYLMPYGADCFLKVNIKTLEIDKFDVKVTKNVMKSLFDYDSECFFSEEKFDLTDFISLVSVN